MNEVPLKAEGAVGVGEEEHAWPTGEDGFASGFEAGFPLCAEVVLELCVKEPSLPIGVGGEPGDGVDRSCSEGERMLVDPGYGVAEGVVRGAGR